MTEDMVEGPRGSSTGQKGSHEMMLSKVIMEDIKLLDGFNSHLKHTLNSTHSILKQANQQEVLTKVKLVLQNKYPAIHFIKAENEIEIDSFDDDDHNSSLINVLKTEELPQAQPQQIGQMCPMCFRLFPWDTHTWSMFQRKCMLDFINDSWEKPPYQQIVEGLLQIEAEHLYVQICQPCTCFIKKYSDFTNQDGTPTYPKKRRKSASTKPKHPVYLAVEFILSGGCTLSPCYSVLNHFMESVTYNFPSNPILQMKGGSLYNAVHAVTHHISEFKVPPHTYLQFITLLKWLMSGSQRILVDQRLAKRMRRYICDFPEHEEWWKLRLPESACRFCHGSILSFSSPSFCSTLWKSQSTFLNLTDAIEKIEETCKIIDYVTTFCCKCCKFSVISYEYDCALRNTMKMHITPTADAYYTRMVCLFETKNFSAGGQ